MRDFHLPGRSSVFSENGMCATSHPLAAATAVDVLRRGGNAMDAAIAGAVLLGICEPQMTGIGGDCFVLWSMPGETEVKALNGSGRAPAALSASRLRDASHDKVPFYDVNAITMPGAIDAFCELSNSVGTLGLDAILAPAIDYAEAGVPVAPRVAFDWTEDAKILSESGRSYYLVNGAVPHPGTMFRAPGQAEVLRRIAREGRAGFYDGEVAEDMLNSLRAAGGVHAAADLANTRATYETATSGDYGGLTLFEHPPNGQGATAHLMLNILAEFDLGAMDPFGAQRVHLEAEATKLAYDARNRFIADLDYTTRLDHMLDPATGKALAGLIDMTRAMPDVSQVTEAIHKDTIYITTTDRDGMMVSLIYSIFHGFGSGIASDKFGILFQNRGAGFTLEEGHPNELAGGKRPMHTIIPGMLAQNGAPFLPFGVMGGAYQPAGHAKFITDMVDFGLSPQTSFDAPRSFCDNGTLKVERGYSDDVRAELADLGHTVTIPDEPIGGSQAIKRHESGVFEGASDPRKDGCALGY